MSMFWLYLVRRGVLTDAQIAAARDRQLEHRVPIGRLAIQEKLLSVNHVVQIIAKQMESGERFGEIAVQLGFLTKQSVHQLLEKQVNLKADLEPILIEMGAVDKETLERERKAYHEFILANMPKTSK